MHAIIAYSNSNWTVYSGNSINVDPTGSNSVYLAVVSQDRSANNWDYQINITDGELAVPTVASTSVNPTQPGILEDVTVTATINDETGISSATLYYTSGGSAVFESTAMSGTGSAWSALIPGFEVSRNGIIYYI